MRTASARLITMFTVALIGATAMPGLASAESGSLTAELLFGPCQTNRDDAIEVASITVPEPVPGGPAGADDAGAGSGLIAGYAIDALSSVEARFEIRNAKDQLLGCGEVGGSFMPDGSLIVGIRDVENVGVSGIVYLSRNAANPANTSASFFVSGPKLLSQAAVPNAVPPTAAPTATVPPAPAPQPSAPQAEGITAAEREYLSTMGPLLTDVGKSTGKFSDLMSDPRIGESYWSIELAAVFAQWRVFSDSALAVTPPPAFADIHTTLTGSLQSLANGGEKLARALDTRDEALLAEAVVDLQLALDLMNQLPGDLEAIAAERGL